MWIGDVGISTRPKQTEPATRGKGSSFICLCIQTAQVFAKCWCAVSPLLQRPSVRLSMVYRHWRFE